jgi:hypothetical protein
MTQSGNFWIHPRMLVLKTTSETVMLRHTTLRQINPVLVVMRRNVSLNPVIIHLQVLHSVQMEVFKGKEAHIYCVPRKSCLLTVTNQYVCLS